jgi:enhancing lycopene biosynthesis protein 2
MKPIAVILSGCGVFDGSEIYETVITLLALDKAGVPYQCLAPQGKFSVIDHATHQATAEQRDILTEAARLARGHIKPLHKVSADDFSALIIPGGYGAAKNLSNFAEKGKECIVQAEVVDFARAIAVAKKPAGFICIAPSLIPAIYGPNVKLTIGDDEKTAEILNSMGAIHQTCPVNSIIVDETHKVVTTPAYMLAHSISEAASGIERLVAQVLKFI